MIRSMSSSFQAAILRRPRRLARPERSLVRRLRAILRRRARLRAAVRSRTRLSSSRKLLRRPSLSWSRGVAELRVSEDGADPLRPLGQAAHVADGGTLQLPLAARRRLAGDRLLQIGMNTFIRVQLRAVRGQVMDLDLRAM